MLYFRSKHYIHSYFDCRQAEQLPIQGASLDTPALQLSSFGPSRLIRKVNNPPLQNAGRHLERRISLNLIGRKEPLWSAPSDQRICANKAKSKAKNGFGQEKIPRAVAALGIPLEVTPGFELK